MKLLILWASAMTSFTLAQEDQCNYYDGDSHCINPEATASVTIDMKPLFPTPLTVVYAIDNLSEAEIATEEDTYGDDAWWINRHKGGEVQKVGFWFEYDEGSLNYTESSERRYELAFLFTKSPNALGGSDGGCEELLGKECVDGLRGILGWNGIGIEYWSELKNRPLRNLSCPMDIFEEETIWAESYFAIESESWRNTPHEPPPPGSSRNTTNRISSYSALRFGTFEQQQNTAAVVVSIVTPQDLEEGSGDHIPNRPGSVVNFACARPGPGGGSNGDDPEGGEGPEGDDDGSGSSVTRAWLTGLLVVFFSYSAMFIMY